MVSDIQVTDYTAIVIMDMSECEWNARSSHFVNGVVGGLELRVGKDIDLLQGCVNYLFPYSLTDLP